MKKEVPRPVVIAVMILAVIVISVISYRVLTPPKETGGEHLMSRSATTPKKAPAEPAPEGQP